MTMTVDQAIVHNNKNYFLTFWGSNKDARHQLFNFLTPEELAKFSLTSKKCSEFVRIYNPLLRCTSILNFASGLIPTWEKPQPKQSIATVIGRHLLKAVSLMVPDPVLEVVSKVLSNPKPQMSKRDALAKLDTVRGQLAFIFLPTSQPQPKPLAFRNELLETLVRLENTEAGKKNLLEIQMTNSFYSLISAPNVQSQYEKLFSITFTLLDEVFNVMATKSAAPFDRARLTTHVEELKKEGVKQVGGDFPNEILETAIYSILSQFYLTNLSRRAVREAEVDLKQLIRFALAKMEPDANKSLEQTITDLASTIHKTLGELQPLFDTALYIAKGQSDESYKKEMLRNLHENNYTETILTVVASTLTFYIFRSGSNDLITKMVNYIDFDQVQKGYAHPDFAWFFAALGRTFYFLSLIIPQTIHTFFPSTITLMDTDEGRIIQLRPSKPEAALRFTLVVANALAVGYLGLRYLGIL